MEVSKLYCIPEFLTKCVVFPGSDTGLSRYSMVFVFFLARRCHLGRIWWHPEEASLLNPKQDRCFFLYPHVLFLPSCLCDMATRSGIELKVSRVTRLGF